MTPEPIAILGFGCRFPGGGVDGESFWRLLSSGADAIREIPRDRWDPDVFSADRAAVRGRSASRWGGFLDRVDLFEPEAFGISPREAAYMDPQQRLLLECAWEALENAGLPLERVAGSHTGVFVGLSTADYAQLQRSPHELRALSAFTAHGTATSIAANRLSYCFDLRGPSLTVDTACSSSLVALDRAVRSLRDGDSEMALVGGANVILTPIPFVSFSQAAMLSPDGRCRAFDASANGFVRAEGAGVIVLKRLSDARRDGDPIRAVVLGSGSNQDGRTGGLSMPNADSQAELIRAVQAESGVTPDEVGYMEAHGTGTAVGDPAEARALGAVFAPGRDRERPLIVGSVKTNVGHLEAGSAMASLVKAVLMLERREIPASLHFETPNPAIDFERWRLRVPTRLEAWDTDAPATLGINSFGFGGTNAHAILRVAPPADARPPAPSVARPIPLLLSARDDDALRDVARLWSAHLGDPESAGTRDTIDLESVAHTAALRRSSLGSRVAVVATTPSEAARRLAEFAHGDDAPDAVHPGRAPAGPPPRVAFVFTGQGPQWHGMGRELLDADPVFADAIRRCDDLMRPVSGFSVADELRRSEAESGMGRTSVAQPAIFALQVALVELWASRGVRPDVVIGHSVGEIAAAWCAGRLDLESAARLVAHRGRCLQDHARPGRMLAAAVEPDVARPLLRGDACIAAINAPSLVTVAGSAESIAETAAALRAAEVWVHELDVAHAFHSALVEPARAPFLEGMGDLRGGASPLPMISSVTGAPMADAIPGPGYWWDNIRETVRFSDAVEALDPSIDVVVEVGPDPSLTGSIRRTRDGVAVVPSLVRGRDEVRCMTDSAAALWVRGVRVDPRAWWPETRPVVAVPPHPWRRERFWHETDASFRARLPRRPHPLLGAERDGAHRSWRAVLDRADTRWLGDHRVDGQVVVPAAALLEMMAAAAARCLDGAACTLDDVRIPRGLFLPAEQTPEIETVVDPAGSTLTIASRLGGDDGEWVEHCRASFRAIGPRTRPAPDVSAGDDEARGTEITGEAFYADLRRAGLDYGPAFRPVRSARFDDGIATAEIELPAAVDDGGRDWCVHPAVLDGALQVAYLVLPDTLRSEPRLYLPTSFDRVRFHRDVGRTARVEVRRVAATALVLRVDLVLRTPDGRVAVEVEGFECRAMPDRESASDVRDVTREVVWRPRPLPSHPRVVDLPRVDPRDLADATIDPVRLVFSDRSDREIDARDAALNRVHALLRDLPASHASVNQAADDPDVNAACRDVLARHPRAHPELRCIELAAALAAGDGREADTGPLREELDARVEEVLRDAPIAHARAAAAEALVRERLSTVPVPRPVRVRVSGPEWRAATAGLAARVDDPRLDLRTDRDPGPPDDGIDLVFLGETDGASDVGDDTPAPPGHRPIPGAVEVRDVSVPPTWWAAVRAVCAPPAEGIGATSGSDPAPISDPGVTVDLPAGLCLRIRVCGAEPAERGAEGPDPHSTHGDAGSEGTARWRVVDLIDPDGGSPTATALLEALPGARRLDPAGVDGADPVGLVVVADPPPSPDGALPDASRWIEALHDLLKERAVHRRDVDRLVLVTRGASVLPGDRGDPGRGLVAGLHGIARVAATELPDLDVRIVDLDPGDPAGDAPVAELVAELAADDPREEVAWRAGRRYVPDVVPAPPTRTPAPRPATDGGTDAPPFRIVARRTGDLGGLAAQRIPASEPGPHDVVVSVRWTALNFRDVLKVLGSYPVATPDLLALGDECVGVIRQVGSAVRDRSVGERVLLTGVDLLRSEIVVPADRALTLPSVLDGPTAAALPIAWLTADHALRRVARLEPGESVLIHSAAGGVGLAAVALALGRGARVFGTAGTPGKRALLRRLGVERAMDSRSLDFADEVRAATGGRGVDVVLNSLAGRALERSLATLAPFGRFVELGRRDFLENTRVGLAPLANNASFHAVDLSVLVDRPAETTDRLAELVAAAVDDPAHRLPHRVVPAVQLSDALRDMARGVHVGKLVVDLAGAGPIERDARPWTVPDGTVLVTGAFGGLGRALVDDLVERGARHVVLVGRSGPRSPDARALLDRLAVAGVEVHPAACDVSDPDAVRNLLSDVAAAMPPIRSVFHLAMVLDDVTLAESTSERLRGVLRPKLDGARVLHDATLGLPIEAFVLFSSASAVTGNFGQAAYAAANAALDGLARHRRARGLPATSMAWGAIEEIGVLADRTTLLDSLERTGIGTLRPEELAPALDAALDAQVAHRIVFRADWGRLGRSLRGSGRRPGLFTALFDAAGDEPTHDPAAAARVLLSEERPGERRRLAIAFVRARVASVLGSTPASVETARPLSEMGLDSLMGVELVDRLSTELAVSLPLTALSRDVTVESVADRLVTLLFDDGSVESAAPSADATGAQSERLPVHVPIGGPPEAPAIWCLPPAGGDVAVYRGLAEALGDTVRVEGLESRVLHGASREYADLDEMAEACTRVLLSVEGDRDPAGLVGFSMGGRLAVEVANRLAARGRDPGPVTLVEYDPWWTPPEDRLPGTAHLLRVVLDFFERRDLLVRPGATARLEEDLPDLARIVLRDEDADPTDVARGTGAPLLDWLGGRAALRPDTSGDGTLRYVEALAAHIRMFVSTGPPARVPDRCRTWLAADGFFAHLRDDEAAPVDVRVLEADHFSILEGAPLRTIVEALRADLGTVERAPLSGD